MKKTFIWALLIGIGFMFMGCPYHSDVAIDTPTVKIDAKLLGKWQKRTSDDETYIVTQKDAYNFKIVEKEKTPSEGSKDKEYTAFLSKVGGTTFMNLYDPTEDTKTYYFYKLDISDETGGFTLYPVTEYITETFTASTDLQKFIQSNMGLSFFYGSKEEYIKVGK
ncbi:MAG TPA: hypothetical protein VK809_03250 [Bacteroidia bacterium]|jgi:hypothetical protein|nr:hypothetical protein [Bacteroidia bacterium]